MNSIKTKIMSIIIVSLLIMGLTIGTIGVNMTINSTREAMYLAMNEVAVLTKNDILATLESYKVVVQETGKLTRLSSSTITIDEKRAILMDRVKQYGFIDADVADTNGKSLLKDIDVSNRDYFKNAMAGNVDVSDVLVNKATDARSVFISAPLWEGGVYGSKVVGVVFFIADADFLNNIINQISIGQKGYVFIIDSTGTAIAHKDKSITEKALNIIEEAKTDSKYDSLAYYVTKMSNGESGYGKYSYEGSNKLLAYVPMGLNGWSVGAQSDENEFLATALSSIIIMIIATLAVIAIVTIISYLLTSKMAKNINTVMNVAKNLQMGILDTSIQVNSKDEIGVMAHAMSDCCQTIRSLTENIVNFAKQYGEGDIDAVIDADLFSGEYKNIANEISSTTKIMVSETLKILDGFSRLADGNFNAELEKFKGKKVFANNVFNSIKQKLGSFNTDILYLVKNASDGVLSVSVDVEKYQGDWRILAENMNNMLKIIDNSIQQTHNILVKLSAGNFNVVIDKNCKGSFAGMMNSLEDMVKRTSSYIEEISASLQRIAKCDLTYTINRDYIGDYGSIKDSINSINQILRDVMNEISESSKLVNYGSSNISTTAMSLASGASAQTESIDKLSTSINEIQEQFKLLGENITLTEKNTDTAENDLITTNNRMHLLMREIEAVDESSNAISKIIKTIDDIAFQTNLLALNAAVEAARAGTAGKGFSVVAEEVRNLAIKSSESARDTAELIESTVSSVAAVTKNAVETVSLMDNITNLVKDVAKSIRIIAKASEEEYSTILEISSEVEQISSIVTLNSATSEESAAASQELSSQANLLNELISKFKL